MHNLLTDWRIWGIMKRLCFHPTFSKLAEGVATLKAVHALKDKVEMPICNAIYEMIYNGKDAKDQINELFKRPNKPEFGKH